MSRPSPRPKPHRAAPELLVLARFEEFCIWLFATTPRWPKRARFTLTRRLEDRTLDILEELTIARYRPSGRRERLDEVNLALERTRRLLRLAHSSEVCPQRSLEAAIRALDEVGRMLHGWRSALLEDHATRR